MELNSVLFVCFCFNLHHFPYMHCTCKKNILLFGVGKLPIKIAAPWMTCMKCAMKLFIIKSDAYQTKITHNFSIFFFFFKRTFQISITLINRSTWIYFSIYSDKYFVCDVFIKEMILKNSFFMFFFLLHQIIIQNERW